MKFGAPFLGAFSLKDPMMIRDYVQIRLNRAGKKTCL